MYHGSQHPTVAHEPQYSATVPDVGAVTYFQTTPAVQTAEANGATIEASLSLLSLRHAEVQEKLHDPMRLEASLPHVASPAGLKPTHARATDGTQPVDNIHEDQTQPILCLNANEALPPGRDTAANIMELTTRPPQEALTFAPSVVALPPPGAIPTGSPQQVAIGPVASPENPNVTLTRGSLTPLLHLQQPSDAKSFVAAASRPLEHRLLPTTPPRRRPRQPEPDATATGLKFRSQTQPLRRRMC